MVQTSWSRIIRFIGIDGGTYIGEPTDEEQDVGLALFKQEKVLANIYTGESVLDLDAQKTGKVIEVERLLCPLLQSEVGSIRAVGLNYMSHAKEANLPLPPFPILMLKPNTALSGPFPEPIHVHKNWQDNQADYETELAVILGKQARDVKEEDAMDYVLGFCGSNDVTGRKWQHSKDSQWCYAKGFDNSAPIGPTIVSTRQIPDPTVLHMTGSKNGVVVQDTPLDDLIFSIPKLVSFLSQGTTLQAGTVIMTGTPSGVGFFRGGPEHLLQNGDSFCVHVSHGIGSLINVVKYE